MSRMQRHRLRNISTIGRVYGPHETFESQKRIHGRTSHAEKFDSKAHFRLRPRLVPKHSGHGRDKTSNLLELQPHKL